ncbi:MAG: HEAT repeat domain-containing protein [Deltaproteobacteria bacterium]|jgi:hypothetical protein|nr:HEAT repeat domain-containing protein [Deltaproteobacteria bacterium]
MGTRQLKKEILEYLSAPDLRQSLACLTAMPARQVVNALFGCLYHMSPPIKWHAVSAMGAVVSNLAHTDMEASRIVMRRLIWNLNDESGGIGWGSPEAMGEITACHRRLADEYHRILVSYINPDGNFLEHAELQKGLLWGLARLADTRPALVMDAGPFLLPHLQSTDAEHRGLAALTAGAIRERSVRATLENLLSDQTKISLYWHQDFHQKGVAEFAENALKRYRN